MPHLSVRATGLMLLAALVLPVSSRAMPTLTPIAPPTLPGAALITLSPDDKHLYENEANELSLFTRAAGTGLLDFVGNLPIVDVGVFSPDGLHAYAAGFNAVNVYARNAATGELTFVESQTDGVGGVDGLLGTAAVAVSPDGAHVYAVSASDNAVAAFSRNATTGALTFVEAEFDGVAGVDGLDGAYRITVSPDGAHVYVLSLGDDAVAVFSRNAGTGALTFVEAEFDDIGGVTNMEDPYSVVVSPDGAHVYVASSQEDAVLVFSRNAGTGALTLASMVVDGIGGVDGLNAPTIVAVSSDGAHVYVGGFEGLTVFSRNAGTGALTFIAVTFYEDSVQSLAFTADGAQLYAGYTTGVVAFDRSAVTGLLSYVDNEARTVGGSSDLAVSADGAYVYVVSPGLGGRGTLAVFARDNSTGALSYVEVKEDDHFGVGGLGNPSAVALSPDGAHVYVTARTENAVTVFARNAGTGRVTFVESQVDGVGGVDGIALPSDIALSPDGAHVYVAGGGESAVTVFARNAGTGALTFVEVLRNGFANVEGLAGPRTLLVSPEGTHVYVGSADDAIVMFDRNMGTGELLFARVVRDDVGGIRGLTALSDLAISADGDSLYATGYSDDAVVRFTRDVNGNLNFVETEVGGRKGVTVGSPLAMALSPDGRALYAIGGALTVFAREAPAGTLAYAGTFLAPFSAAGELSPDGRHLYVAASTYVETYAVSELGCTAAPITPCRSAGRSSLTINDRTPNDRQDGLVWRWLDGDATDITDFGLPQTTDHFSLCVYDESGPSTLVLGALAPAGGSCDAAASSRPCWAPSSTGIRYRDRFRTPEGVTLLKLTPGAAGEAGIFARAGGEDMKMPGLPLGLPLRIQLQSAPGECWESVYGAASVNTDSRFRASE
jgi:6-phosphogluconolactonase (cycloisomerase 2 family)